MTHALGWVRGEEEEEEEEGEGWRRERERKNLCKIILDDADQDQL